jgi:hypothetical protein
MNTFFFFVLVGKGKGKNEKCIGNSDKSEHQSRTYDVHCMHFGFTGGIFTAEERPQYLV